MKAPRQWTLILTGPNSGPISHFGDTWPHSPDSFERVNVREILPDEAPIDPPPAPVAPSPAAIAVPGEIPAILFDSYTVYQALNSKGKARTSPENVTDTLDAIVRLLRGDQDQAQPGLF